MRDFSALMKAARPYAQNACTRLDSKYNYSECCLDNEHARFYFDLAIERNLSKLSLMREIEAGAFEKAHSQPNDLPRTSASCPSL
jgi:hypothetical protein